MARWTGADGEDIWTNGAAQPPLPLELETQNSSDTEAILRQLMEHLATLRQQKTVLVSPDT